MIEKNMPSTGNGHRVSPLHLSMMIFLFICAIGITLGCDQVSSDTAMQCYGCIQALQKAISSALQEGTTTKGETKQPMTLGKTSQWALSTKDLITLDQTLRELMKLGSLQKLLQTDTTTSYSASEPTQAELELKAIYDGVKK